MGSSRPDRHPRAEMRDAARTKRKRVQDLPRAQLNTPTLERGLSRGAEHLRVKQEARSVGHGRGLATKERDELLRPSRKCAQPSNADVHNACD
eukprot:6174150-Pleurochrysis_carterae.AAC.3